MRSGELVPNLRGWMVMAVVLLGLGAPAAHAAAIGAACEVPPKLEVPPLKPVARTNAPAANRSVLALRFEKHVGCLGAVALSVQPRKVVAPPETSHVAAFDTTLRMQAGALLAVGDLASRLRRGQIW